MAEITITIDGATWKLQSGDTVVIEAGEDPAGVPRVLLRAADSEENQGGEAELRSGNGTVGGRVRIKAGEGIVERGGDIEIEPGEGESDGGDLKITLPHGDSGRDGLAIIENMPTADPGVSNALWVDGGVIKISAP